jgi:hypothetical protein
MAIGLPPIPRRINRGVPAMSGAVIIRSFIPRIVREPDAPGWLVILGSYGWSFGSRGEAVHAARELTNEVRP